MAKRLLCSDEGLSLVLRTLVKKKKCRVMVPACGSATREPETDEPLGLGLHSQPGLIGKFQAGEKNSKLKVNVLQE